MSNRALRDDVMPTTKDATHDYPPPEYLLWEITLRCNFKCIHCAARAGKPRENELTTDEALALCDQIAQLGIPGVALMGGEPLLRRDWTEIAAKLRDLGVHVGLITNGYFFDERVAQIAADLGFIQVGISLDGADPAIHNKIRGVPNSHERALRAIQIVNDMQILYPTVITSINQHNIDQLHGMKDYLEKNTQNFLWIINDSSDHEEGIKDESWTVDEKGYYQLATFINTYRGTCDTLNISGTHSLGYFAKGFNNLHNFRWRGCEAGRTALGLRSNGDVAGCLILPDPFIEGNVRTRGLADIWNDPASFAYTRSFDRRKLKGKCRKCEMNAICKAGCTNQAYCRSGTIYEYPYCLRDLQKKEMQHVA